MFERREEILRQGEIDVVEGCHATKESNRELKREYSLCRSRLRKISSYQPTECPGINSSNGRKVWSIDPIEYVRPAPYVFDPGGGSDRGWYSLTSEKKKQENEAIVSVTNFHYPPLLDRPPFLRMHSSSRSGKRAPEEESSCYSVVEYLFAPIGLLRESTVVQGTRDESEEIDNQIHFWQWKRSIGITMVARWFPRE